MCQWYWGGGGRGGLLGALLMAHGSSPAARSQTVDMRTVFALRRPQKERSLRWLSSQKSPGGKIVTFEQVEESTQNGVRNNEPRMGYIRTAAGHAGSTGKLPSHCTVSLYILVTTISLRNERKGFLHTMARKRKRKHCDIYY